jgi:hypothetical protein
MEGVVVEVPVRAPCKRFAIKGNAICDRSAPCFDGHKAKLQTFFSPENNTGGDTHKRSLKENSFWIADQPYFDNDEWFMCDQVLCVFLACELIWLPADDRNECQLWGIEA